jgi:DNA-binding transcriptional MerR regulator
MSAVDPRPPMSNHDHLLKIGDFAREAKTNLRTLRYYEELGLLQPAARSEGGFRYYRPTDVNRVRLIWDLQELGLQLERISELLGKRDSGQTREELMLRVRQALAEQDRLLQERVRVISEQRAKVSSAVEKLAACECCNVFPSAKNNHCEPCGQNQRTLPELISALF